MSKAHLRDQIALPNRRPPFIVVNHAIEAVTVTRWPGRLWKVQIVDPVTEHDERASQLSHPQPSASYTRAIVVDIIQEVPAARLFGERGKAVCAVIDVAMQLDLATVEALRVARHADASSAYMRSFDFWREKSLTRKESGSPINSGFSVIQRTVGDRASSLIGDAAFIYDQKSGETSLNPTWQGACGALLDAAMALAHQCM